MRVPSLLHSPAAGSRNKRSQPSCVLPKLLPPSPTATPPVAVDRTAAMQAMGALRQLVRCTSEASRRMSTFLPSPKKLDDIMKVENMEGMQPEQIEALWMEYHSDETRNRAGLVMPAEAYRLLLYRAASAPLFVLPLGKGEGRSLSMLLQWQLPHCLITELDHYKQVGTSARPHLMVTHYTELEATKGIVLVRGDVLSPHIVSVPEARTLMALGSAFYVDAVNYVHVHNFNHDQSRFDYNQILQQLGHSLPDGG